MQVLSDAQWKVLEPLIEAVRPRGKTPPRTLRRTIEAILWRHQNGARWRSIPAELGPGWAAAQTFLRWARKDVWERLLERVRRSGISFGMVFLDGTNVRAHQKAGGAAKKNATRPSATAGRRWAGLVAAMAPRRAWSPTGPGAPLPARSLRVRRMNRRWLPVCSGASPASRAGWSGTAASPPTPSATWSGTAARAPRSRPSATRSRSPARPGFTRTATSSRGSGPG
jgi:transposase